MLRKAVISLSFLVGVLMGLPFADAADTTEPGKQASQSGAIDDGMREEAIRKLKARGIESLQYNSKLLEVLAENSAKDTALAEELILAGGNVFADAKGAEELRERVKLASSDAELLKLLRRAMEADEKIRAEAWASSQKELETAEKAYRKSADIVAQMGQDKQGTQNDLQRKAALAQARAEMANLEAALEQARHKNTMNERAFRDARLWKMLLGAPQGDAAVNALIERAREAALAYTKALKEYPEAEDKAAAQDKINTLNSARVEADGLAREATFVEHVLTGKSYSIHYVNEMVEHPDGTKHSVQVPQSPQQADEASIVEKVYKGVDADFFAKGTDLSSPDQVMAELCGMGISFPKGCSASYNPRKRTLKVVTRQDIHKDVEKALDLYKSSKPSLENMPGLSLTSGKLQPDTKLYVLFLVPKKSVTAHRRLNKDGKNEVKTLLGRISKRLRQIQKRSDVQFVWMVEKGTDKTELKNLLIKPLRIKGAFMTYTSDSRYIDGNYGNTNNYGMAALDKNLKWFFTAYLDDCDGILDAIDEWAKENPASK